MLTHLNTGKESTHLVGGSSFWLTLLDDLEEGGDDIGVELTPGIRE
jgi:hypothetical protein